MTVNLDIQESPNEYLVLETIREHAFVQILQLLLCPTRCYEYDASHHFLWMSEIVKYSTNK